MYPWGIQGWTGRIGSLGPMNMVGAAPGMMPFGVPQGGIHPMMPAMMQRPGVPFGMPQPGGLQGPVPGMSVQQSPQQDAYALILALPSTGALATTVGTTISVTPQRPMRIERFVTTATAGQATISQMLAGVDSQFIGAGNAVDASVFGPGAFGVALRGSTVYPGITISLTVTNISAGTLTFQGWCFIGTSIA